MTHKTHRRYTEIDRDTNTINQKKTENAIKQEIEPIRPISLFRPYSHQYTNLTWK